MTQLLSARRRRTRTAAHRPLYAPAAPLPWVTCAPDAPYFTLDTGEPWTPIGANESITWPGLDGLFRRRDLPRAEAYLESLRDHGVTVLRLMLEYSQGAHRYFERPAGHFVPAMVRLWDDLFHFCERLGLRILLTPYDTFFQWVRWARHPYNARNGGPCADRTRLLVCADTRALVKRRLTFATERWGGSGALFAWDLWNEVHPAQGAGDYAGMAAFLTDVGDHLRDAELRLHGRAHPQTASVFGPELLGSPEMRALILRNSALDFVSTHLYAHGTIDDPRDTVAPAVAAARLIEDALDEAGDTRPYVESEHGPIHRFKDHRHTLPAEFDDEYFRHIQWAHLASGGAGGGMRWPNRDPHVLTPGMRQAQHALARVVSQVEWSRFRRINLTRDLAVHDDAGRALRLVSSRPHTPAGKPPRVLLAGREVAAFACGDARQLLAFLLRADTLGGDGRLRDGVPPVVVRLRVPGLGSGSFVLTAYDATTGVALHEIPFRHDGSEYVSLPAVELRGAVVLVVGSAGAPGVD